MTYDEVIKAFGGSAYKVGIYKINGVAIFSSKVAYHWKRLGYIPIHTQIKIEKITNGALKANLEHCKHEL